MSFNFNSQMCHGEKEYKIQITTDNYEQFLFMQEKARECIDNKHADCKHIWADDCIMVSSDGKYKARCCKCIRCGAEKVFEEIFKD